MSSMSSLFVMTILAAASGPDAPVPPPPSTEPATVTFVAEGQTLAGIVHGIDAIDAQPRAFGERLSASVAAGLRTIWYSCPDGLQMEGGSRLSFDFVAGKRYQLECRPGQDAEIRSAEEC